MANVFNHKKCNSNVAGIPIDFEKVEGSKAGDKHDVNQGANGVVTISVLSDEVGSIKVTLKQGNPQNAIVAAAIQLVDTFPVLATTNTGGIFSMSSAVLKKDPDFTIEQMASEYEWEFIGEFDTYLPA